MYSADSIIHRAVRLVDVNDSPVPHAPRLGNIFCPCGIVMCFVQQLQGLAEAAIGAHARIDRRVIFEILAVVDRGPLDLADGCIDRIGRGGRPGGVPELAGRKLPWD